MDITIISRNVSIGPRLRQLIEKRLHFALHRFSDLLGSVKVTFSDINGPRGGVNKHCRIVVDVESIGTVVIRETDKTLSKAITRAASRLSQSVSRLIKKRQLSHRRKAA